MLVLSASSGSGHLRAASALIEAFARVAPEVDAVHVDTLHLGPRWVRTLYDDVYELLAARAPGVWRQIYRRTDGDASDEARWWPTAELFGAFRQLLGHDRWDLVLCTHFLPCQLAEQVSPRPPLHLVVTDFTLHKVWVQQAADMFYVPLESMSAGIRKRIPGAAVSATGIPIAGRFAGPVDRREARRKLGLANDRPVVTVTAGGMGLRLERTVEAVLLGAPADAQVVAVCGHNRAALETLRERGHDRLTVLGYVDDMPAVLAAADLVVAKPGGLTTSETLALGRPLLLTTPIPGQEEENARALVREQAARYAPRPIDIPAAVGHLLNDSAERERLARNARALGRPHAAERIVGEALASLARRRGASSRR